MTAIALGTVLIGFTAALMLKRAPAAAKRADGTVPGTSLKQALTSRAFVWMYVMCGFGAFSMFIPFAHLLAAARDLGVSDARAVGLVGLIGIGSLTGRFAIGALADRVGRPVTLVLAQASLGASFILLGLRRRLSRCCGVRAVDGHQLWRHRVADARAVHGPVRRAPVSSIIGTLATAGAADRQPRRLRGWPAASSTRRRATTSWCGAAWRVRALATAATWLAVKR